MRAIVVQSPGGPEALELADLPAPPPGPDQLLVDVHVAGVNYIDINHRSGAFPVAMPYVLGQEGCGVVSALGAEVKDFVVGQRVAWAQTPGSYAEQVAVPAREAVAVPDGITDEQAGGLLLQGLTAHYLANSTYALQPGDVALIHAAAGGVGLLLTQLAKARGARVIATSSPGKAQLARDAGADEVLRYAEVPARVRELTNGRGVDVVYDGVGAATFEGSLASLRPRGLLALFGQASGAVPPFDLFRLSKAGSLFVTRPTMAHYLASREELLARAEALFAAVQAGVLSVRLGGRYELADAASAHRYLAGRGSTGKLILLV